MSDFVLEYESLEAIARYSRVLGKSAAEYSESLERQILDAIGNVTGASSGYLMNASDSVRNKTNELKQKSDAFNHYAEQISHLLEAAKEIDQEVADTITAQSGYFLEHHESLRLEDWKAKSLDLLVDIKNSWPFLNLLGDILNGMNSYIGPLQNSVKHWYKCQNGKDVIQTRGVGVTAARLFPPFIGVGLGAMATGISGAVGVVNKDSKSIVKEGYKNGVKNESQKLKVDNKAGNTGKGSTKDIKSSTRKKNVTAGKNSSTTKKSDISEKETKGMSNAYCLTKEQLVSIGYSKDTLTDTFMSGLNYAIDTFIIDGCKDAAKIKERICKFIAQISVESQYGKRTIEYDYGDHKYFYRTYKSEEKFGDIVDESNGLRCYCGGGYIMLTGRSNYKAFAKAMGDDDIYKKGIYYVGENYAWQATGWWWKNNGMNGYIDAGHSVKDVSLKVNGGTNGLDDRTTVYNKVKKILK